MTLPTKYVKMPHIRLVPKVFVCEWVVVGMSVFASVHAHLQVHVCISVSVPNVSRCTSANA